MIVFYKFDKLLRIIKIKNFKLYELKENLDTDITNMKLNKFYILKSHTESFAWNSNKIKIQLETLSTYYFKNQFYNDIVDVYNFFKRSLILTHPEHFNILQIIYGSKSKYSLLSRFTKKAEILVLSYIYEQLRNKYAINFQKRIDEYKADITINHFEVNEITDFNDKLISGVIIEIDENDHQNRNPRNERIREQFLQLHGYKLIRIPIKMSNLKELSKNLSWLDNYIQEIELLLKDQYFVAATKINYAEIERIMNTKSIDRDFYQIIGKSITKDDQYNIHIDDITKYVEYNCSRNLIRYLKDKNFNTTLYKEYTNEDYISELKYNNQYDGIVFPPNFFRFGKIHWLISRRGFYEALTLLNKPKARQSVRWMIDIYEIAMDYLRVMNSSKSRELELIRNNIPVIAHRDKLKKEENKEKILVMKNKLTKMQEMKLLLLQEINTIKEDHNKTKQEKQQFQEFYEDYKDKVDEFENEIAQKEFENYQLRLQLRLQTEIDGSKYPQIKLKPNKVLKCLDVYNLIKPDMNKNDFYNEICEIFKIKKKLLNKVNYFIGIKIENNN